MTRDELIDHICTLRDEKERGNSIESLVSAIESAYGVTDLVNLCDSDYPEETIADIVIGTRHYERHMTESELRDVIRRFTEDRKGESESILLLMAFEFNCVHPAKGDLLIRPREHFGKNNPTYDEILSRATQAAK